MIVAVGLILSIIILGDVLMFSVFPNLSVEEYLIYWLHKEPAAQVTLTVVPAVFGVHVAPVSIQ